MAQLATVLLFGLLAIGFPQQSQSDPYVQQTLEQQQTVQSDAGRDSQQVIPSPEPIQKRRVVPPQEGIRRRPDWSRFHEVWPGTVQQPDSGDPVIPRERDEYRRRQSGLDGVTSKINPDDVNYGGLLALWRRQLVHDTLLSAEYWGVVAEGILIVLLLFYVVWMRNQRTERFRMAVDMVHQLANSRAFARFHARRVIGIHNELVRRLNDEYERKLRSGQIEHSDDSPPEQQAIPTMELPASTEITESNVAGRQQDPFKEFTSSIPAVAATEYVSELGLVAPFSGRKSNPIDDVLAKANAAAASTAEITSPAENEQEDKDAKIRRLEAQVDAKDQRIRALRNNLNRQRQTDANEVGNDELEGIE